MGDLSRDDVLARIDSGKDQTQAIEVPEWEGTVYVRKLSVGDLRRIDTMNGHNKDGGSLIVNNLVLGVCDAEGKALFTKADAKRLMDADLEVATRISKEINSFNGMGEEEVKAVAEDFGQAQDDGSSSE